MTVADRLAQEELSRIAESGLTRRLEPLEGPPGATVRIEGRELINFSSNDYLGLAAHPALAAAARDAAEQGTGAGASRHIVGSLPAHRRLEEAVARLEEAEAAVLFNSGYCANLGVISSLVTKTDAVFSDALNHASLIDGALLARASVSVYRHLDLEHLAVLLSDSPARRKLIVTDSVFSMDGDLAPLAALVELAERHGAMLLVDEAHATGVFGARGAGRVEEAGLSRRVDVRNGTFSKAAGSFGAFSVGSRAVVDLLIQRARSLIFTTALPPTVCAASLAGLGIIMGEPERRARLWGHVHRFAAGLRELGLPAEPRSPIFPVLAGTAERALALSAALRERGILAKAIRPPTVPDGTSRLRFSLSATHTEAQLEQALSALRRVR